VIDRDGRELGQYPNSSFVDWRPNGGLTIKHELDSGVSQLEHLSETWELQIIFTTEPNTLITNSPWMNGGGKWSPDGRYFIFTTENYDNDKTQLYLWLPEEKQVRLIPTQEQDFSDPIWLPDSTAFYFIINGTIWEYGIATAD
jgi:dipeptidyl aminopeptidase/acylaminoacyl peptidase